MQTCHVEAACGTVLPGVEWLPATRMLIHGHAWQLIALSRSGKTNLPQCFCAATQSLICHPPGYPDMLFMLLATRLDTAGSRAAAPIGHVFGIDGSCQAAVGL